MKISQLKKEIKGVFKQPKKFYYFGKIIYGTPYFNPINFLSSIIYIRKLKVKATENQYSSKTLEFSNLPMVRRNKYWIKHIFNNFYYIEIGYPFSIRSVNLGWKDKYETPRFEWCPSFQIYFFYWQFCIFWKTPLVLDIFHDDYYEQILWYLKYCDKDINKARDTWVWRRDGISTWNNEFLENV